jgi:CHASE3 domain sensor protein
MESVEAAEKPEKIICEICKCSYYKEREEKHNQTNQHRIKIDPEFAKQKRNEYQRKYVAQDKGKQAMKKARKKYNKLIATKAKAYDALMKMNAEQLASMK